jgi:hypothetical protein
MRALNVVTRAILFAITRNQAAHYLESLKNEPLSFFLARIRLNQSLGLITLRDLPLAIKSRRKAFLLKKEKIGPK